ncbi:hypothetical protein [Glycomyces sp. NPDC047010]|uniref:hypothetical protein n=1 Tax=Glycomyces sp. NPDC047010 TaxID=3155023 RepID=UPI0034041D13
MPSATSTDLAALVVSVVSVLVAVVGISASARPPKRHLRLVACRSRRLLPFTEPDIEVVVAGETLNDPYITEVRYRSTGRFDFTEANGDISLRFTAPVRVHQTAGTLFMTHNQEQNVLGLSLDPFRCPRKRLFVLTVLTEGITEIALQDDPLKDATARLHHVHPKRCGIRT